MECPPRQILERYLRGDIEGDEREALEDHLNACAPCAAILGAIDLDATASHEPSEGLPLPNVNLPPDQVETIRERGYILIRELGRGGFGTVYLAHQGSLNREVAIKVLSQPRASDPRQRARFTDEMQRAARLKHPNIVAIHSLEELPRAGHFAVMDYLDGGSLEDRMLANNGPFPADEAVKLLIQSADALACAHKNGLASHRDLKPANILLDKQGKPYVADFGLAVGTDEERFRRAEHVGTPAYMSPEQIRNGRYGRTEHLYGCDIWAMGVILYEMLAGRRPFEGRDRNDLYDEIEKSPAIPPRRIRSADDIDDELERICLKCLEKAPNDRYTTAGDLRDELQRWVERRQGLPLATQEIRSFQDLLAWHRRFEFVGREAVFRRVNEFLSRHDHGLLVVTGQPGKGKSAFLTYLAKSLAVESPLPPISFYYGSGSDKPDQLRCNSQTGTGLGPWLWTHGIAGCLALAFQPRIDFLMNRLHRPSFRSLIGPGLRVRRSAGWIYRIPCHWRRSVFGRFVKPTITGPVLSHFGSRGEYNTHDKIDPTGISIRRGRPWDQASQIRRFPRM